MHQLKFPHPAIAPGPYAKHEIVATGLGFPEGPIALMDGSVLVVEIEQGCLTQVFANGTKNGLQQLEAVRMERRSAQMVPSMFATMVAFSGIEKQVYCDLADNL